MFIVQTRVAKIMLHTYTCFSGNGVLTKVNLMCSKSLLRQLKSATKPSIIQYHVDLGYINVLSVSVDSMVTHTKEYKWYWNV